VALASLQPALSSSSPDHAAERLMGIKRQRRWRGIRVIVRLKSERSDPASPAFISTATRVFQLRTGGTTQLKGASELDTACSIVARRVTLSSLRSSNAQGRASHPICDSRQSFATEPAPR